MKTIVWDVDDVLNDCMRAWFTSVWEQEHPDTPLRYEDLTDNPPHSVLGIRKDDYLASLDRFRHTPAYADMRPVPETLAWFNQHGERCHHVALTAVPQHAAHVSADWVMRHFGRWFRTFAVIPSKREDEKLPQYDDTKGAYLARMSQVDCFIDDSPSNINEARERGIPTLYFPRPWNDERHRSIADALTQLSQIVGL